MSQLAWSLQKCFTNVRGCGVYSPKPVIGLAHLWQPFKTLHKPLKLSKGRSISWLVRKAADNYGLQDNIDLLGQQTGAVGIERPNPLVPRVCDPRSVLSEVETAAMLQVRVIEGSHGSRRVWREVVSDHIMQALSKRLLHAVIIVWRSSLGSPKETHHPNVPHIACRSIIPCDPRSRILLLRKDVYIVPLLCSVARVSHQETNKDTSWVGSSYDEIAQVGGITICQTCVARWLLGGL